MPLEGLPTCATLGLQFGAAVVVEGGWYGQCGGEEGNRRCEDAADEVGSHGFRTHKRRAKRAILTLQISNSESEVSLGPDCVYWAAKW
jgi:hypothetical protein